MIRSLATFPGFHRRENGSSLDRSVSYPCFFDGTSHFCSLFRRTSPAASILTSRKAVLHIQQSSNAAEASVPKLLLLSRCCCSHPFRVVPARRSSRPLNPTSAAARSLSLPQGARNSASSASSLDLVNLAAHPSTSALAVSQELSLPLRYSLGCCTASRAVQNHITSSPLLVNPSTLTRLSNAPGPSASAPQRRARHNTHFLTSTLSSGCDGNPGSRLSPEEAEPHFSQAGPSPWGGVLLPGPARHEVSAWVPFRSPALRPRGGTFPGFRHNPQPERESPMWRDPFPVQCDQVRGPASAADSPVR